MFHKHHRKSMYINRCTVAEVSVFLSTLLKSRKRWRSHLLGLVGIVCDLMWLAGE